MSFFRDRRLKKLYVDLGLNVEERRVFDILDRHTKQGSRELDLKLLRMGIERIISNMNHKHEIRGEKTYPEVEKALRGLYENEDYRNEMLDKYRGKILNKEDYKELFFKAS